MTLQEFLEHIDPIFFRIAARELDISQEGDATQTKQEFIRDVTEQGLETHIVLGKITELGLKNGLHKIPRDGFKGAARTAAVIAGVVEDAPSGPSPYVPFCPSCDKESPKMASRCISCGNKFPLIICQSCGTENVKEAFFCMSCGERR